MTNEEHTIYIEKLLAELSHNVNNLKAHKLIVLARQIDEVSNKLEVLAHIMKERKENNT